MLLTCIGYWLAAEASTLGPQDVHSKDFTPWLPDEESALKVESETSCM